MRTRKKKTMMSVLMVLLMLLVSMAVLGNGTAQGPPIADPNGPYYAEVGEPIILDGSMSYDPGDGLIIMYAWDWDGDGEIDYQEDWFNATDGNFDGMTVHTYTLQGIWNITLTVQNEWGEFGEGTTFAVITEPPQMYEIDLDIKPETLNLASNGRWMTCFIEPIGFDVSEIELSSLALTDINGIPVYIPVEPHPFEIGDHDEDGNPDLMVKVDRGEVQDAVPIPTEIIELTLTGTTPAGVQFSGSDTVKTTAPKVVEHQKLPDGGHYWKYSNGLEHWVFKNGTELWKWPDGTEHWIFPDGRELWIHPDGLKHWIFPDGDEVWIWPDGTRWWKKADGTEVWITPADLQRIRDLINSGNYSDAINETLSVFGINLTVTGTLPDGTKVSKTATITYDPNLGIPGQTARCGAVTLGPGAFNRSIGWLATVIQHELVHVRQDADGTWNDTPQGEAMNECEAYDENIRNADKKGLTDAEKAELQRLRKSYYDELTPENQARVDDGIYTPA